MSVIDIVISFVFEIVLYILPVSEKTSEKLRKYSSIIALAGILIVLAGLLALIGWVNMQ